MEGCFFICHLSLHCSMGLSGCFWEDYQVIDNFSRKIVDCFSGLDIILVLLLLRRTG